MYGRCCCDSSTRTITSFRGPGKPRSPASRPLVRRFRACSRQKTAPPPPGPARGLLPAGGGLAGRFGLLLVRPDHGQGVLVYDVGHRDVRALVAERPGRLAPALRLDAELLAQQGHRDLRLVQAITRQLSQVAAELHAGLRAGPDLLGVAAVLLEQQPGQVLD